MKKLINLEHGQIIRFITRYSEKIYVGNVNHFKQDSGRIFPSVHCEDHIHFIESEITQIL